MWKTEHAHESDRLPRGRLRPLGRRRGLAELGREPDRDDARRAVRRRDDRDAAPAGHARADRVRHHRRRGRAPGSPTRRASGRSSCASGTASSRRPSGCADRRVDRGRRAGRRPGRPGGRRRPARERRRPGRRRACGVRCPREVAARVGLGQPGVPALARDPALAAGDAGGACAARPDPRPVRPARLGLVAGRAGRAAVAAAPGRARRHRRDDDEPGRAGARARRASSSACATRPTRAASA